MITNTESKYTAVNIENEETISMMKSRLKTNKTVQNLLINIQWCQPTITGGTSDCNRISSKQSLCCVVLSWSQSKSRSNQLTAPGIQRVESTPSQYGM